MNLELRNAPVCITRRAVDLSVTPVLSDQTLVHVLAAQMRLSRVPLDLQEAKSRLTPRCWTNGGSEYSVEQLSLHHYLSQYIEQKAAPTCKLDDRSHRESLALGKMYPILLDACLSGCGRRVFSALLQVSSVLLEQGSVPRRGSLLIRSEDQNAVIEMPDGETAARQLQLIAEILASNVTEAPIARATFVYVALLNAHPFGDGNGRLARVLFNFALRRAGMCSSAYVPIFSAMRHSRGGYEIRVREAEIGGHWDPIVRYLCKVIEIVTTDEASPQ